MQHAEKRSIAEILKALIATHLLLFRLGLVPRSLLGFHRSSGKDSKESEESEESDETEELTA
jgi:hypothetical protein